MERVPVRMSLKLLLQQKLCWFIWCAVVRDYVFAELDILHSIQWCRYKFSTFQPQYLKNLSEFDV